MHGSQDSTATDIQSEVPLACAMISASYIYSIYFEVMSTLAASSALRTASAPASAGGTDRDLAGTQFSRNCVPYNIIEC
jgi:hypothetical protein